MCLRLSVKTAGSSVFLSQRTLPFNGNGNSACSWIAHKAWKNKLMINIFISSFCRHPYLYAQNIQQMKAYVKDWIKGILMAENFSKGTSRKKLGSLTFYCSWLSPASLLNCNHWVGNWCSWGSSTSSFLEPLPTFAETEGWHHWSGTWLQYGAWRGNTYTVLFKPESVQWTNVVMPTCVKDGKTINDQNTNVYAEFLDRR